MEKIMPFGEYKPLFKPFSDAVVKKILKYLIVKKFEIFDREEITVEILLYPILDRLLESV
jgi:hypothetical protein